MKATSAHQASTVPYWGEMLDCDGHLYLEPKVMVELVGRPGGGLILDFLEGFVGSEEDVRNRKRNRDDVFQVKGISALGACDPKERVEALDLMGIQAQFLFPNTTEWEVRVDSDEAREACRRYNDYCIDWSAQTQGRGRAVGQINMTQMDWALKELRRVLDRGMKGALTAPSSYFMKSPPVQYTDDVAHAAVESFIKG